MMDPDLTSSPIRLTAIGERPFLPGGGIWEFTVTQYSDSHYYETDKPEKRAYPNGVLAS